MRISDWSSDVCSADLLEKPLRGAGGKRGRIDVWFRLTDDDGRQWRCAIELKFFKRKNHREPNNRYEVFKDIARLESCGDVADVGFMIVRSEEHTSELQSLMRISYAVFCLKKKKK